METSVKTIQFIPVRHSDSVSHIVHCTQVQEKINWDLGYHYFCEIRSTLAYAVFYIFIGWKEFEMEEPVIVQTSNSLKN